MAYISSIGDEAYRIDLGENGHQREITIEGTAHSIDWRMIAPLAADAKGQINLGGRYTLIIAGRSYEVFARRVNKPDEVGSRTFEVQFAGQRFEIRVEDEREKTLAGAVKAAHDGGEAKVLAPMPGLVLSTPLEVGASVERGQTVVVLEAMKMENDLGSPMVGRVKEVRVSKGQTVNQGDVLVVIGSD